MGKIALVTDSTCNIPTDLAQRYHVTVAPQVLIWGPETMEDGIDILPNEFYARLRSATVMPSTSQITVKKFKEVFEHLLKQGFHVLAILVSEKLSGTINSAIQARELLPADAPVEIIDSQSVSMGLGFQVLAVARAIEQGAGLAEAIELAKRAVQHTGLVLTPETLEFLHRGGRIGGATRFLGAALNIKPILEIRHGRVEAVERVRTRAKSLYRVVDLIEQQIGKRTPVRIAALHANAEADARLLLEEAASRFKIDESIFAIVSPVVGTHAGPGACGLAFMAGM
jgi:DegV family protein with EDD domain